MMERRNLARGVDEWAAAYGNLGAVIPAQLMNLPVDILDPWEDADGNPQPFNMYTPKMLEDMVESILECGIIEPICVRPRPNGRFQILAGHNRVTASKIAGLKQVPAYVRQVDDAQAEIMMLCSNLKHRAFLLPSEKARAYAKLMEKLRCQGKRTDLTCAPLEQKSTSRDAVAKELHVSHAQVQRYIRLTYLLPPFLDMVDNAALDKERQEPTIPLLAIRAGVELSYLTKAEQELLLQVITEEKIKPPAEAKAAQLRKLSQSWQLNEDTIRAALIKSKNAAPKDATVKLSAVRIRSFFPPDTPPEQMEAEIYEALLAYRKNNSSASI